MTQFTDFQLPSKAIVHVQSSLRPPAGAAGVERASGVEDRARETWGEGLALVRELSEGVVESLRTAIQGAEQVTVEFGVTISGKTSVVLVEGSGAANLKVTISWKGKG